MLKRAQQELQAARDALAAERERVNALEADKAALTALNKELTTENARLRKVVEWTSE